MQRNDDKSSKCLWLEISTKDNRKNTKDKPLAQLSKKQKISGTAIEL